MKSGFSEMENDAETGKKNDQTVPFSSLRSGIKVSQKQQVTAVITAVGADTSPLAED